MTAPPLKSLLPCGLTTKGINFSSTTNEVDVPDCDNPDAPAWVERDTKSKSAQIQGSGILAMETSPLWWDWFKSGESRNIRVKIDEPGAINAGYWEGHGLLTGFNVSGEIGAKVNVEVTIDSDGEFVWVKAVP